MEAEVVEAGGMAESIPSTMLRVKTHESRYHCIFSLSTINIVLVFRKEARLFEWARK